jgi:hypothetical protein
VDLLHVLYHFNVLLQVYFPISITVKVLHQKETVFQIRLRYAKFLEQSRDLRGKFDHFNHPTPISILIKESPIF